MAAVTAKNYFDENAENTVAIEKGKLSLKWYISYNYPKWKIVEYDSAEDVVKAVRSGEADCFVDEIGRLAKYIEDKKLYVASLMQQCNISFAVDLENTVLLSVLNKTLDTMSAAMFSGALSMYENSSQKVTFDTIYKR